MLKNKMIKRVRIKIKLNSKKLLVRNLLSQKINKKTIKKEKNKNNINQINKKTKNL